MSSAFGQPGQWTSTFSPQQQNLQNQTIGGINQGAQDITQNPGYQSGLEYLMSMFQDPNFFSKFEAPMQRQFQEQTVPQLANQFAGMGTHGSFGTGFRNQLAREGTTLQEKIAALRGGMQQQGASQLLNYAQQPTQNFMQQYGQVNSQGMNNVYQPATSGWFGPVLTSLIGGLSGNPGMFAQGNNNSQPFAAGQGEAGSYGMGGSGASGLATGAAMRGAGY